MTDTKTYRVRIRYTCVVDMDVEAADEYAAKDAALTDLPQGGGDLRDWECESVTEVPA